MLGVAELSFLSALGLQLLEDLDGAQPLAAAVSCQSLLEATEQITMRLIIACQRQQFVYFNGLRLSLHANQVKLSRHDLIFH